jgi:hypothetical protein
MLVNCIAAAMSSTVGAADWTDLPPTIEHAGIIECAVAATDCHFVLTPELHHYSQTEVNTDAEYGWPAACPVTTHHTVVCLLVGHSYQVHPS